jgi:hypothetical protein
MRRVLRPKQRLWVISALLLALVVRALIPAGFMPAIDRPFSFQICPDGFPAALLSDLAIAGADERAATGAEHAGHHHPGGGTFDEAWHANDGALTHAGHHHNIDGAGANPGHHHHDGDDAPALSGGGLMAAGHHHNGPAHNHSSVNAEHCVFAAAAGAFALVFLATFSAPAGNLRAPDAPYVSPAFESHRFRIPQPRGPPALS